MMGISSARRAPLGSILKPFEEFFEDFELLANRCESSQSTCRGEQALFSQLQSEGEPIVHIHMDRAVVCVDCMAVSNGKNRCPACASEQLWQLQAWLDRKVTPDWELGGSSR